MIKVYRKTATINAEQFDGSDEMIDKYDIEVIEGWIGVEVGEWIVTGVHGEHWIIADAVFKQTYAELPVIPEEVYCLIKQTKEWDYNLGMVFYDAYSGHAWNTCVSEWIMEHADIFARAWIDGYQVEEDK